MEFRIYRDRRREWRWRLVARNGQVLADSGEGYKRRADCLAAIELVKCCADADLAHVKAERKGGR